MPLSSGLPVDNEVRDQIIVDLRQGKDGYDPMGAEAIAQIMGIIRRRVDQILVNLEGASSFTSDKNKVREAIRLFLQGVSHRKIASHPDVTVNRARISQIVNKSDTAKIHNL